MNLKNFTFLSLIASVALVSVSCDQLKDLTYNTTPNPLEMHGDSVAISVTVNIPPKGIKKKVSVEAFSLQLVLVFFHNHTGIMSAKSKSIT
jgi:hypothetical protein